MNKMVTVHLLGLNIILFLNEISRSHDEDIKMWNFTKRPWSRHRTGLTTIVLYYERGKNTRRWNNYSREDQSLYCLCNRTAWIHKFPAFQQKVQHQRCTERGNALCIAECQREKMWEIFYLMEGDVASLFNTYSNPLCVHTVSEVCVCVCVCVCSAPFGDLPASPALLPTAESLTSTWDGHTNAQKTNITSTPTVQS